MTEYIQKESILSIEGLANALGMETVDFDILKEIYLCTPDNFRPIVHYALIWGIGDDVLRSSVVEAAPENLRRNLKWVVNQFDHDLDEWLAGPEAKSENPTKAYIAFSNMRMGADEIL